MNTAVSELQPVTAVVAPVGGMGTRVGSMDAFRGLVMLLMLSEFLPSLMSPGPCRGAQFGCFWDANGVILIGSAVRCSI